MLHVPHQPPLKYFGIRQDANPCTSIPAHFTIHPNLSVQGLTAASRPNSSSRLTNTKVPAPDPGFVVISNSPSTITNFPLRPCAALNSASESPRDTEYSVCPNRRKSSPRNMRTDSKCSAARKPVNRTVRYWNAVGLTSRLNIEVSTGDVFTLARLFHPAREDSSFAIATGIKATTATIARANSEVTIADLNEQAAFLSTIYPLRGFSLRTKALGLARNGRSTSWFCAFAVALLRAIPFADLTQERFLRDLLGEFSIRLQRSGYARSVESNSPYHLLHRRQHHREICALLHL